MNYVFDTSSLIHLGNYFPARFPSLWKQIDGLVQVGRLISVREVFNELHTYNDKDFIQEWAKNNNVVFPTPDRDELLFVAQIFSVKHFQALIGQKSILKGTPVADPFVIASAKTGSACVVTQESKKDNAAKIPNICEHFSIPCTNLEGFMEKEGWSF